MFIYILGYVIDINLVEVVLGIKPRVWCPVGGVTTGQHRQVLGFPRQGLVMSLRLLQNVQSSCLLGDKN